MIRIFYETILRVTLFYVFLDVFTKYCIESS